MNSSFSDNLKSLRQSLLLTQKEFSKRVGITPSTISAYEKGEKNPTLDTLIKISQEFNISLDELCGFNKNTHNNIPKVETYPEIFVLLEQLYNLAQFTFIDFEIKTDHSGDPVGIKIYIDDDLMVDFMSEYKTMLDLKNKGSINDNIFDEWYNSKLCKYNDIVIKRPIDFYVENHL